LYLARPDRPASTCSANLGAAARMGGQAAILIEEIPMPKSPIVYLELPSNDVAACKQFYHSLFEWSFQDFGPDYAAFSDSGLDGGLNGASPAEGRAKFPLAVIDTGDLEAMEKRIVAAGGSITLPIFAFPGGRRFHFTDPSGNELAVMQKE
jgi:predicted enzyme related to lactoylglutathione lyase